MIEIQHSQIDGRHGKPILADLHYRPDNSPKPVIIFCHGYKGFKDWGAWNLMANSFANAGYYFVKFNFSHNGGTLEQPIDFPDLEAFGQNNYSKELDDLGSVIDWLFESTEVRNEGDLNRVFLLGHSRGGAIVTVKAEEDPRVKKIISLAGISSFRARFHEETQEFKDWKALGVKYIENGRTKQQMPHYFQFYEDYIGNKDRLNIERAVKNLHIPHLIIHGDEDTSIYMEEAEALHRWNPESKLVIIKGANHVFETSHPWNKEFLSDELQEVVNIMLDFIGDDSNY
jgi:pimeloyl-ACP methyl ester carboxylesterase